MKTILTTICILCTINIFAQTVTNPEVYSISDELKEQVFHDDFDKFNNYWLLGIEENSWIENIENGQLFFQSLTNKPKEDVLPVIIDQTRNFEIEISIKFEKGDMEKAYGLQWGKSNNPVKQYDFYLSGNGQYTIDKYTGEFHDFVPFTTSDFVNRYAHNKLTIRKAEESYYFFINENLVHTMPFEPFFGNLLGFQVAENSTILIDYIHVSYLGKEEEIAEKSKVLIMDYEFSTETEKIVTGTPITLKVNVKNIGDNLVENISFDYKLPENIEVVDFKSIEKLDAEEEKVISLQFFATKEFTETVIPVKFEVEGVDISNVNDFDLSVELDKVIPTEVDKLLAQNYSQFRGSSDPLKGLNVAQAMNDVQIGNYYAVIIGIDSYSGVWKPLKNAVNDAKAVEASININYRMNEMKTLYNEDATRENIIAAFEWLMENSTIKDNIFIYYSGHGEFKEEISKGYWVPIDATTNSMSRYISNDDIKGLLAGIKSKHTLLVADACFSGDLFRGKTMTIPYEESTKYYNKIHSLMSRKAISSGGIEPVMDGGKEGHSVFAYYFLKSLESNESKYYDASELYNDLKIPVVNNSEQTPQFNPIKNTGDEGGQFIFIKK
jgi:Caspase domain